MSGVQLSGVSKTVCPRGYITKKKFEMVKLDHEPTTVGKFLPHKLRYILSHFIGEIIENIIVEMRVVK